MELTTLKPTERTIEIGHPATGEAFGIRVSLVSIDDDKLQRVKREIADESLKMQARNKSMKMEQIERNGARILWTATTRWEWYNPTGKEGDEGYDAGAMPTFNGQVPDYTQANFSEVCKQLPWFADQVREAVEDTKSFFEISKPN